MKENPIKKRGIEHAEGTKVKTDRMVGGCHESSRSEGQGISESDNSKGAETNNSQLERHWGARGGAGRSGNGALV